VQAEPLPYLSLLVIVIFKGDKKYKGEDEGAWLKKGIFRKRQLVLDTKA